MVGGVGELFLHMFVVNKLFGVYFLTIGGRTGKRYKKQ